jgi:formylglycine-generating enzyme required for sulfatase activity
MIGIPAGEFTMGASGYDPDADLNEKPAHLVKLKSFAIGKYPITRRQWRSVFDPSNLDAYFDREYFNDFPDLPIEWVSWNKTQEFCQKLKKLTKKNYDLPSEAQWEYACRAGTISRFYWGDDVKEINNHAWFVDNSGGASHVVGEKVPNAWGLYDMAGNVWEWCADNWRNNYSSLSVEDNGENEHNQLGILRGGCWGCSAVDSRSSNRQKIDKNYASKTIGLRIIYSF